MGAALTSTPLVGLTIMGCRYPCSSTPNLLAAARFMCGIVARKIFSR
jgi:hypothetical protein